MSWSGSISISHVSTSIDRFDFDRGSARDSGAFQSVFDRSRFSTVQHFLSSIIRVLPSDGIRSEPMWMRMFHESHSMADLSVQTVGKRSSRSKELRTASGSSHSRSWRDQQMMHVLTLFYTFCFLRACPTFDAFALVSESYASLNYKSWDRRRNTRNSSVFWETQVTLIFLLQTPTETNYSPKSTLTFCSSERIRIGKSICNRSSNTAPCRTISLSSINFIAMQNRKKRFTAKSVRLVREKWKRTLVRCLSSTVVGSWFSLLCLAWCAWRWFSLVSLANTNSRHAVLSAASPVSDVRRVNDLGDHWHTRLRWRSLSAVRWLPEEPRLATSDRDTEENRSDYSPEEFSPHHPDRYHPSRE